MCAVLVALASGTLAGCTGRVPGTGRPTTVPPGVVYEPAGARVAAEVPAPVPAADPPWLGEPAPAVDSSSVAAPAPDPSASSALAPAPASAPAPPTPARYSRPSSPAPGSDARERQIAILTEAVAALRQEIARGYAHSQELLEETKRLRIQVRTLREDLDKSRAENQHLRAQIRTLERRLGEIRVAPPVADATRSSQPAEPPASTAPSP